MAAERPPSGSGNRKKRAGRGRRPHGERSSSSGGESWIFGYHPVREALRANRRQLVRLWLREGPLRPDDEELVDLARSAGIEVQRVDRGEIERVLPPDVQSQGVALRAGPIPERTVAELIRGLGDHAGAIVALDGVEDPQNVGAIARVAESAGASGLILTDRRAPGLTPAVARASAGAIEWLPVARTPNLTRALEELKAADFWVAAASAERGQSLFEMEDRLLLGRVVVVLGAEGSGVRPGVLKACDHRVWIPMRGEVSSLNVSTAAAVILFDLLRRTKVPQG